MDYIVNPQVREELTKLGIDVDAEIKQGIIKGLSGGDAMVSTGVDSRDGNTSATM